MKRALVILLPVFCTALCAQKVNPHSQINWPPACAAPGMVYNFVSNTCIDVTHVNPASVTWPTSCSAGGVYSPAANTCVPTGTAANPAGNSGEAQINLGGTFNAIPGSAPLGTNGMQYQGDLKANNFIGASAVSTPAAIGYRQNAGASGVASTAVSHNRDQTTAMFATPQDFCVGSGTGPPFDDTDCFNKAIRWLASSNNGTAKTLYVPWTANGYYLGDSTYQFLYTLPYDFGDYHGSAGYISPASASAYFTGGQLTSCAIQGGSGYAPNAQLPIQILDPQHIGSGAAAYVLTDPTGTPASTCVIQLAGMNYPQMGTQAAVIPLGGDGAVGTCVLNTGAFTSCSITAGTGGIPTGGSGYNDGTYGTRLKVPLNVAGLTCTPTYPVFAPVYTGSSVTGVTVTTPGTSCVYGLLSTPVNAAFSTATTGGTLVPGTYFYRVAALDASGSTLASTETSMVVPAGTNTNTVTVNWGAVSNAPFNSATSYKVYGRTTGTELLIATVSAPTLTYTDTGSITPSGALPTPNTTGLTSGTFAMQFGASCGGIQCTLLPMETPRNLPLSVALLSGVQIVGVGNPVIRTDFSFFGGTPNLTRTIAFGDPWGDQAGGVRQDLPPSDLAASNSRSAPPYISNINVNAQIAFAFPLLSGGTFDRVTCGGGLCYYIGNTLPFQVNSQTTFPDSIFRDNIFLGIAGIFVGGDWKSRAPDAFAGGNQGGTIMAHGPAVGGFDLLAYGTTGGISIENLTARFQAITAAPWDQFFEQNFWKAQNSPAVPLTDATHLLSNMSTTCLVTSAFSTRATDANFGKPGFLVAPWGNCYRGVVGALVSALSRYSNTGTSGMANNTVITNTNLTFRMRGVRAWNAWRPLYMGTVIKAEVADAQNLVANAAADPYLPGGVTNAWVWLSNTFINQFQQGSITDVNTGLSTIGLRSQYWGITENFLSVANLLTRNINGFADQYGKETISTNSLTTTAATSDVLTMPGMTLRGRCQITATNASAATNISTTYISSKATAGQITVTHTATAGMIYDVACTIYN